MSTSFSSGLDVGRWTWTRKSGRSTECRRDRDKILVPPQTFCTRVVSVDTLIRVAGRGHSYPRPVGTGGESGGSHGFTLMRGPIVSEGTGGGFLSRRGSRPPYSGGKSGAPRQRSTQVPLRRESKTRPPLERPGQASGRLTLTRSSRTKTTLVKTGHCWDSRLWECFPRWLSKRQANYDPVPPGPPSNRAFPRPA